MSIGNHRSNHWRTIRSRLVSGRPDQAAAFLLRYFQIEDPPVNVKTIAERMGVPVRFVRNPGWSGAVSSEADRAVIWVNGEEAHVRQRFTIAHEIGHLLLHPTGIEYRDGTFSGSPQETQANSFAAELLMPAFLIDPLSRRYMRRASSMASAFDVSELAMKYRLANVLGGHPDHY